MSKRWLPKFLSHRSVAALLRKRDSDSNVSREICGGEVNFVNSPEGFSHPVEATVEVFHDTHVWMFNRTKQLIKKTKSLLQINVLNCRLAKFPFVFTFGELFGSGKWSRTTFWLAPSNTHCFFLFGSLMAEGYHLQAGESNWLGWLIPFNFSKNICGVKGINIFIFLLSSGDVLCWALEVDSSN